MTKQSGAHIRVLSSSHELDCQPTVCFLVKGSQEQISLAQCVLESLASDCEPVSEVIEVPQTAFGRIIGNTRDLLLSVFEQKISYLM